MNKLWLAVFFSGLIISAIHPKDYQTWFLEVAPAIVALIVMIITRQHFRLTSLVYNLILVHSLILMVGGHYTYAEVSLFDWLKDVFAWQRNNYDKLGHFTQGFVPAMVAREIIIRKQVVNDKFWLNFFVICICLAISAFYELIEWWVAVMSDEGAEAFLGTQGYVWDTQSDMVFALGGAIIALLSLSKQHDRQLNQL